MNKLSILKDKLPGVYEQAFMIEDLPFPEGLDLETLITSYLNMVYRVGDVKTFCGVYAEQCVYKGYSLHWIDVCIFDGYIFYEPIWIPDKFDPEPIMERIKDDYLKIAIDNGLSIRDIPVCDDFLKIMILYPDVFYNIEQKPELSRKAM